jgi:hypothetical protein
MKKHFISIMVLMALGLTSCGGGGSASDASAGGSGSGSGGSGVIPSVSIADTSIAEGNAVAGGTMAFTVTLSSASTTDVSINYATSDNTALAASDYTAASGTLTIPAGATSGSINVPITADSMYETDETLTMTLSAPTGATLGTATATGTITNDDAMPRVSVSMPASIVEGNSGVKFISPAINLSAVSGVDTTITYSFTGGNGSSGNGTLTIAKGQRSPFPNASLPVTGDTLYELGENAVLTLTGATNATLGTSVATTAITNDDAAPTLSVAAASVNEGNVGTSNLDFTVTLNTASGATTTVNYLTTDGTATRGNNDYTLASGTLSIPAGATSGTVRVFVTGDTVSEADETLTLTLSNTTNAGISTATATGTIINDDVATAVSMAVSGKSLDFTWSAASFTGITAANIDHYRILVNPDGASGFTVDPYAANIPSAATSYSLEVPVHKTNWLAAQYTVEACNLTETTCGTSANQTLALIDSVAATIYTKASNTGLNDYFGLSVSLSSDGYTLAVGAYSEDSSATGINGNQTLNNASNSGAVYVFSKTGNTWAQQAYIKASNTGAGDYFGYAVSLSSDGNTLAVGAYLEGSSATGIDGNQLDNTILHSGAAYVFSRTGSTWTQQAYVKASNTGANDYFGAYLSLSSDGNTLAVSAFYEDSAANGINGNQTLNNATNSGEVYVFSRTGTVWAQQAYVKASNTGAGDGFGGRFVSLSSNGNTLAVGAYLEDSLAKGIGGNQGLNNAADSGAVYVFSRTGTAWAQQAYIKASNTEARDYFGYSASLSGDGNTLAVGAYGEDSAAKGMGGNQTLNTTFASGAVYVFSRTGTAWTQQAYVKASNTWTSDSFGWSVSLSSDGNTLAVGAHLEDSVATGIGGNELDDTATNSGAVYVFSRTANTWAQKSYVKASNTGANDQFGYSVSLSADGNTMAVGANSEASAATGIGGSAVSNGTPRSGAVYLY